MLWKLHRQYAVGPLTHLMLAFEFPGGWRDVKRSVVVTVMQFLMGGGGAFSTGGPGLQPLCHHSIMMLKMVYEDARPALTPVAEI